MPLPLNLPRLHVTSRPASLMAVKPSGRQRSTGRPGANVSFVTERREESRGRTYPWATLGVRHCGPPQTARYQGSQRAGCACVDRQPHPWCGRLRSSGSGHPGHRRERRAVGCTIGSGPTAADLNLQFIDVGNRPRSIVVSSSVPAEGKSTIALNLAVSLADTGARIILVDADLRRPSMAEYVGSRAASV